MPETKENVVQFAKRKAKEIIGWIKDPKTAQAFANAGNILGSSEYPRYGTESEERYNEAINEQDPEVKSRQNGILIGVVTIPTVTIPGSQYVYGALGTIGMQSAINNYASAKKEKDEQKQNDAIFNGALAFSTVLPMINTISKKCMLPPGTRPILKTTDIERKPIYGGYANTGPIYSEQIPESFYNGLYDAIMEKGHPVRRETISKNNQLIDRLDNYVRNVQTEIPISAAPTAHYMYQERHTVPTVNFDANLPDTAYGVSNITMQTLPIKYNNQTFNMRTPLAAKISINPRATGSKMPGIGYHEGTHSIFQYMPDKHIPGEINSGAATLSWKQQKVLKQADAILESLNKKGYNLKKQDVEDYINYLVDRRGTGGELPVFMRQIGYEMGLKQGQQMPISVHKIRKKPNSFDEGLIWNPKGVEEVKNLVQEYVTKNPDYEIFMHYLDFENHPDRIWRLLTDTYKLGGKLKYGTNN